MSNLTYTQLRSMNRQEVFDYVTEHLFRQGEASRSVDGLCSYRGDAGKECAVGCIIPDKHYRKDLEGLSACGSSFIHKIEEISPPLHKKMKSIGFNFLRDLQCVHDMGLSWKDTRSLKERLKVVARDYNLNTDVFKGLRLRKKETNGI